MTLSFQLTERIFLLRVQNESQPWIFWKSNIGLFLNVCKIGFSSISTKTHHKFDFTFDRNKNLDLTLKLSTMIIAILLKDKRIRRDTNEMSKLYFFGRGLS